MKEEVENFKTHNNISRIFEYFPNRRIIISRHHPEKVFIFEVCDPDFTDSIEHRCLFFERGIAELADKAEELRTREKISTYEGALKFLTEDEIIELAKKKYETEGGGNEMNIYDHPRTVMLEYNYIRPAKDHQIDPYSHEYNACEGTWPTLDELLNLLCIEDIDIRHAEDMKSVVVICYYDGKSFYAESKTLRLALCGIRAMLYQYRVVNAVCLIGD